MKKVLILSGSPRKGGNSDTLCDRFMQGAIDAGHQVEKIFVAEKEIAPCRACYYCASHNGACTIHDDMAAVLQKMIEADVLVLSTPVYFYTLSAQLKAVIDRTVARWLEVHDKDFYYIMTSAEDGPDTMDATLASLRGYAACVQGATEKGVVYGKGVYQRGEILDKPDLLRQAYDLGHGIE